MRKFALLFVLYVCNMSCQSPNEDCCDLPKQISLGQPFSIIQGESMEVENSIISITFEHLISDSLCPEDVECVTQGTLKISVDINGTERTLAIGDDANTQTEYRDYKIELQELVYPTKQSEKDNVNSTYAVQMLVTRS